MHPKKVGIEDWREDRLLHDDLRGYREELRGVVEVVSEEDEPVQTLSASTHLQDQALLHVYHLYPGRLIDAPMARCLKVRLPS